MIEATPLQAQHSRQPREAEQQPDTARHTDERGAERSFGDKKLCGSSPASDDGTAIGDWSASLSPVGAEIGAPASPLSHGLRPAGQPAALATLPAVLV